MGQPWNKITHKRAERAKLAQARSDVLHGKSPDAPKPAPQPAPELTPEERAAKQAEDVAAFERAYQLKLAEEERLHAPRVRDDRPGANQHDAKSPMAIGAERAYWE